MFTAKLGAFFLAPLLAATGFMAHAATGTNTNASTSNSSWHNITSTWHWPDRGNGHSATTTPATTTPPTISPLIASEDPTAGPIGTSVTLTGSGFASSSVVRFGQGAVTNVVVSQDGTRLTFSVPSYVGPYCPPGMMCPMYAIVIKPGVYAVSVQNPTGAASNAVNFTVTSTSTPAGNPLAINGIDAPTSIPVGTEGTWTVHVTRPTNMTGDLHYSATWGDEVAVPLAAIRAPDGQVQASTTFTHVYGSTGTYDPTFTVTDDQGHRATVGASVEVTPIY